MCSGVVSDFDKKEWITRIYNFKDKKNTTLIIDFYKQIVYNSHS